MIKFTAVECDRDCLFKSEILYCICFCFADRATKEHLGRDTIGSRCRDHICSLKSKPLGNKSALGESGRINTCLIDRIFRSQDIHNAVKFFKINVVIIRPRADHDPFSLCSKLAESVMLCQHDRVVISVPDKENGIF